MPQADPNAALAYLRTRVNTATPAELRLLLLDGAIRFARQGRDGLAARDFEKSHSGITQCRAILLELATNLRRDIDPDLCDRVYGLYMFLYQELISANMEKSAERTDRVIEILEYERETWSLLMKKLEAGGSHGDVAAPAAPSPATRPRAPISLSA